jgi:hypothetical protein
MDTTGKAIYNCQSAPLVFCMLLKLLIDVVFLGATVVDTFFVLFFLVLSNCIIRLYILFAVVRVTTIGLVVFVVDVVAVAAVAAVVNKVHVVNFGTCTKVKLPNVTDRLQVAVIISNIDLCGYSVCF